MPIKPPAPRIYNLFPLLVGQVPRWHEHLPRVAAMGFDTVYVNPVHAPGPSGNLYNIADYDHLNPLFATAADRQGDRLLADFAAAAAQHGLAVMTDLVLTHVDEEAPLLRQHPEWAATVLDGLAEFDWGNGAGCQPILDFFAALVRRYVALGFRGFRCVAALRVPAEIWRRLIGAGREAAPDSLFCAEALGAPPAALRRLAGLGFDFAFNSVKWWDGKGDWLFDEAAALRHVAPAIGFPESHDTERLAVELERTGVAAAALAAHYRERYALAACFSSGVLMPMGFEWGWRHRLDSVTSRPEDGDEARHFDIADEIAAVNGMKRAIPALGGDAAIRPALPSASQLIGLARVSADGAEWAFSLINPDATAVHAVATDAVLAAAEGEHLFLDEMTPGREEEEPGLGLALEPLQFRAWRGRAALPPADGAEPVAAAALPIGWQAERRIAIEDIWPQIDGGRYPVKRIVGDAVEIWADIFRDGHDKLAAVIQYRRADEDAWRERPMLLVDNDRWRGAFTVTENARYRYRIMAWTDHFASWRDEVGKKRAAGQDVRLELIEGRALVAAALTRAEASQARPQEAARLARLLAACDAAEPDEKARLLLSRLLAHLVGRWPDRGDAVTAPQSFAGELEIVVDRERARCAAWYEMFQRSQGTVPGKGASFADCIRRLPEIAALGFDVVYLVPIHPIGRVNRKGRDNALVAAPGDPGSPYAIGGPEGGHTAVHPELGTLDDFRRFVAAAARHDMEVALDFAVQCAPDHPWVRQHPDWFSFRPDGTIKFAENPPKKYQDIVNVDFYNRDREALWHELRDVILFWANEGVRIFRVDNPHTKPVPFWEWCIREVQAQYPDAIFLAEAFTRPKMMKLLAKAGYTQSYSYFTWRNTKAELTTYLSELTQGPEKEYMLPNFFANTPDILPRFLQADGRPAFLIRLVLAATLSPTYGIYNGFELCENAAIPNSEEYLHSEKYEYKVWDWDRPGNIKAEIAALNRFRRANPAMRLFTNLVFCPTDDDNILAYLKWASDPANIVLVALNLDPVAAHEAVIDLPLARIGVAPNDAFALDELFSGARLEWRGAHHRLRLGPAQPAMIFQVTPAG